MDWHRYTMSAIDGAKVLLALLGDGGDPHRPPKRQRPKNPIQNRQLHPGDFWIAPKGGCPEGMVSQSMIE